MHDRLDHYSIASALRATGLFVAVEPAYIQHPACIKRYTEERFRPALYTRVHLLRMLLYPRTSNIRGHRIPPLVLARSLEELPACILAL